MNTQDKEQEWEERLQKEWDSDCAGEDYDSRDMYRIFKYWTAVISKELTTQKQSFIEIVDGMEHEDDYGYRQALSDIKSKLTEL